MKHDRAAATPSGHKRGQYQTAAEQFTTLLQRLLAKLGWLQSDLARHAHLDEALVSRIVRGITAPTLEAAAAMDVAFGTGNALETLAHAARAEPYLALPAPPRFFVGRHAELARLDAVRADFTASTPSTVVVVAGPPGVGKSELALHWANRVQDAFDLVLWANLRGYSGSREDQARPDGILEDLLRGLEVSANRIPATEHLRRDLLRGLLRRRAESVLILLDNARDLAQIRSVLPQTPGTLVVVTSRRRIIGLAQEARTVHVPLAPMEEPDGVELVARYVGEERAAREETAVSRLVSLCASLPLALNIAATLIANDPAVSIRRHVDVLLQRGRSYLLAHPSSSDGDDGAIGVRAAFSWSHEALPADEARMFRMLGAFPGARFRAGAAAALAGVSEADAVRLLDNLNQAHLVQFLDIRFYRLHDLLQTYASEMFADLPLDDQRAAVARLTSWYCHAVNRAAWALMPGRDHHEHLGPPSSPITPPAFTTAKDALRWCASELPNVVPVAKLAFDHEVWFDAWRMPTDLIDYHVTGRPLQVWKDSTTIAVQAAEAAGENGWAAEALDKLAEAYRRERNYDQADEYDRRALALYDTIAAPHPRRGWPLVGLGNSAHARGRFADAAELTGQGLDAFVEAGSSIGELTGRVHRGRALRAIGDREGAFAEGLRALAGFRRNEDVHGIAFALGPLARTAYVFGELQSALAYSEEGIDLYRRASDPWGEADALGVKGLVLGAQGRHADAAECIEAAIRLVETLDEEKTSQLRADLAVVVPAVAES